MPDGRFRLRPDRPGHGPRDGLAAKARFGQHNRPSRRFPRSLTRHRTGKARVEPAPFRFGDRRSDADPTVPVPGVSHDPAEGLVRVEVGVPGGRPGIRWSILLRCTSIVPPAIDVIRLLRQLRGRRLLGQIALLRENRNGPPTSISIGRHFSLTSPRWRVIFCPGPRRSSTSSAASASHPSPATTSPSSWRIAHHR